LSSDDVGCGDVASGQKFEGGGESDSERKAHDDPFHGFSNRWHTSRELYVTGVLLCKSDSTTSLFGPLGRRDE
jgi:hypothetical protein